MIRTIALALVAAALVFNFNAPADAAGLTAKQVKGSVAAMPDMTKLSKKYKLDDRKHRDDGMSLNFEKSFNDGMNTLRARGGYGEAKAIVRKHGFSSPEQWGTVAARVMRAYVALSLGPQAKASRAQMQQSMAMIQNNPQFPAAQKKQMMAQLQAAMKMMEQADNVPAADKAAVKPHMAALTNMMKSMSNAGMGGPMGGGMGGPMGGPMGGGMRR